MRFPEFKLTLAIAATALLSGCTGEMSAAWTEYYDRDLQWVEYAACGESGELNQQATKYCQPRTQAYTAQNCGILQCQILA